MSQYFNEEIGQVMALIRKLVENGCDVNVPDQRGERPLYQSACGGNLGNNWQFVRVWYLSHIKGQIKSTCV